MVALLLVCVNLLSFDSVVSSLFFDPRFLLFGQLTNIFFLACLFLAAWVTKTVNPLTMLQISIAHADDQVVPLFLPPET